VFLKCQKSWRIVKRFLRKQSISKFISPFLVKGAQAHAISEGRSLPINHLIIVSSSLAEQLVRSVLKWAGVKKVRSNMGLEGFLQTPQFQEKDRLKLASE